MRHYWILICLFIGLTGCAGVLTEGHPTKGNALEMTVDHMRPDDLINDVSTDPASLKLACEQAIEHASSIRSQIYELEQNPDDNTALRLFNEMFLALDEPGGVAGLMANVHPSPDLRAVAETCRQDFVKFRTSVGLDRVLYEILSSVSLDDADAQTTRFLERLLRDFKRGGVDRDEPTRKRVAEIQAEMVTLSQDFSRNVREDVRHIEVTSAAGLKGMPVDWIEAHPPGEDGVIRITTDYPDFYPFQTYAENSASREALYREFLTRGYPANKSVLLKVLFLRHELATLLGYENWADYNAEDKMAKSAARIEAFIYELNDIIQPVGKAEIQELLVLKRKDDPTATTLGSHDRFYYVGKAKKEKYAFDSQALRPYFSYKTVRDGIFDLYGELFGLSFLRMETNPVWHPSVEAYTMEVDGKPVGHFFLDMHPRENKFKHAAMFDLRTGLSTDRTPIAALVCNFPDPSKGDGSALMEHSQVVTFFHEFGHLIHHLLARSSPWVTLSGITVELDFVEAPSQILEEWAWDPAILKRFASHVDTGEKIPAELVERLRASEDFGKGVHVMRQMFYTAYSFYLHNQDPQGLDLEATTDDIQARFSPYPRIKDTYVYANFGHLIGYSSMYYTYQWSLVIAKDLFTRFKEAGLMNKETAQDYREMILAPGGTRDAGDLVWDFLGREYNLDAYRKWISGEAKP